MAKKYVKQTAALSLTGQTADVPSQVLFTSDHDGFYRVTSMLKMTGANSPNAEISVNTDAAVFAPALVSCNGEPAYNEFMIWIANGVDFPIWAKSPNYDLFTSFDLQIIVEDFAG